MAALFSRSTRSTKIGNVFFVPLRRVPHLFKNRLVEGHLGDILS
jgi:hypothetical protein